MRRSIVAFALCLLAAVCVKAERAASERAAPTAAVESIATDLSGGSCREEIDQRDPNATPYSRCPGVGGYTLIVRRAEAGRRSVDVVDTANRVFPLDFTTSVTPHMSTLRSKAEWRVETVGGKPMPLALMIAVEASWPS